VSERKQGHTGTKASVPKPKPTQSNTTPSTPTPPPQSPAPPQPEPTTQPKLNPNAMSVNDLAKLLSRVGGTEIAPEVIEQDIEEGMPTNPDGTVSVVHYAAWLVQEMTQHERPS